MNTRVIVSAIIIQDNKFLVLKRASDSQFAPNEWELVSGFMDNGETAEQTILREVKEELNVSGSILKSLPIYEMNDNDGRWVVIPYLVLLDDNKTIKISDEHSELKWMTIEEMSQFEYLAETVRFIKSQKIL